MNIINKVPFDTKAYTKQKFEMLKSEIELHTVHNPY